MRAAGFTQRIRDYLLFKRQALLRLMRHGMAPALRSKQYLSLGKEYERMLKAVICNRVLSYADVNEIYSSSRISIGINDQFNPFLKENIVFYTKLRDFEATIAGRAFSRSLPRRPAAFCGWQRGHVLFKRRGTVDKARFLLKNEPLRKKLRAALEKGRCLNIRGSTF